MSTAVGSVLAVFSGVVAGWPLVMLPAQLIWMNLVTNGLQDVALVFERGEPDRLGRRSGRSGEGVLSTLLWQRAALTGVVMAVGTLLMFQWELDRTGSVGAAQTAALTTMVLFNAVHAGNSRSSRRSAFAVPLRDNVFLVLATAGTLLVHAAALYLPPTQALLGVVPLSADVWARAAVTAVSVLLVVEVDKLIRRRSRPDHPTLTPNR